MVLPALSRLNLVDQLQPAASARTTLTGSVPPPAAAATFPLNDLPPELISRVVDAVDPSTRYRLLDVSTEMRREALRSLSPDQPRLAAGFVHPWSGWGSVATLVRPGLGPVIAIFDGTHKKLDLLSDAGQVLETHTSRDNCGGNPRALLQAASGEIVLGGRAGTVLFPAAGADNPRPGNPDVAREDSHVLALLPDGRIARGAPDDGRNGAVRVWTPPHAHQETSFDLLAPDRSLDVEVTSLASSGPYLAGICADRNIRPVPTPSLHARHTSTGERLPVRPLPTDAWALSSLGNGSVVAGNEIVSLTQGTAHALQLPKDEIVYRSFSLLYHHVVALQTWREATGTATLYLFRQQEGTLWKQFALPPEADTRRLSNTKFIVYEKEPDEHRITLATYVV